MELLLRGHDGSGSVLPPLPLMALVALHGRLPLGFRGLPEAPGAAYLPTVHTRYVKTCEPSDTAMIWESLHGPSAASDLGSPSQPSETCETTPWSQSLVLLQCLPLKISSASKQPWCTKPSGTDCEKFFTGLRRPPANALSTPTTLKPLMDASPNPNTLGRASRRASRSCAQACSSGSYLALTSRASGPEWYAGDEFCRQSFALMPAFFIGTRLENTGASQAQEFSLLSPQQQLVYFLGRAFKCQGKVQGIVFQPALNDPRKASVRIS